MLAFTRLFQLPGFAAGTMGNFGPSPRSPVESAAESRLNVAALVGAGSNTEVLRTD